MSMIIKQKTITISCGDEIRTAERCSGGNAKELFKVTVEEFKEGVCATRIQPIKTGKFFEIFPVQCLFAPKTQKGITIILGLCRVYVVSCVDVVMQTAESFYIVPQMTNKLNFIMNFETCCSILYTFCNFRLD